MAQILCLETATTNCSVALFSDDKLVSIREDNSPGYSHAELLHVFIEQVLGEAGLKTSQLDAIAVSKGPGSYTGLRIGVSAAKGLCFAADLPLISIPTLDLLAHQVKVDQGYIIPLMDARRMEVYTKVLDPKYRELAPTTAQILSSDSFDHFLDKGAVRFIGNGVAKFENICDHPNAHFVVNTFPSTMQMGKLAMAKYKTGDTEDVAYFEPYYLKDFIAG